MSNDEVIFPDDSKKVFRPVGLWGEQWVYSFPNGYGASVVSFFRDGPGKDPYELGVLHEGLLCYDTPLTDDVIGNLTREEVQGLLEKIAALPAVGNQEKQKEKDHG